MTTLSNPMQAEQIAGLAQAALDARPPSAGYRIRVLDDQTLTDDDNSFVVYVVTDNDRRDREFYFVLSEAESALEDEHGLHVQFVPASSGH